MKFGIQTFAVGAEWKNDPEAFYRQLKALGFAGVEPCVLFGATPDDRYPGVWTVDTLLGEKRRMDAHGLVIPSLHVFCADLDAAAADIVRVAEETGVKQIVVKSPHPANRETCGALAKQAVRLADALAKIGTELLIHNENADIQAKIDGKTALEWELDACAGKLLSQADVGWVLAGGEDAESFLWRNAERVASLHYKDFRIAPDGSYTETNIGEGDLPLVACFQFGRAHGLWHIIDSEITVEDKMAQVAKSIAQMKALAGVRENTSSVLVTVDTLTGDVRELRRFDHTVIEAPNWLTDGDTLVYNADGRIWRYRISDDAVEEEPVEGCVHCNNDHVPSADNRYLAVSCDPNGSYVSHIYIKDLQSGAVRQVTQQAPSFLHGWSPDGRTLAYCAFRPTGHSFGDMDVDIYAVPAEGGAEIRLTDGTGYNDGPEYAPDGQSIWYNSTRSGRMQVWRMNADGSNPTQMTRSDAHNWFPHLSPDGRTVAYLSFREGDLDAHEHLPNMRVQLRLMNSDGTDDRALLDFFGGQGSINVNSWAPDGRRLAMVIYELHHK